MSGEKGNTWSASLLKLLFQAVAAANIADNAATAPLTALFVSLHTADPTANTIPNFSETVSQAPNAIDLFTYWIDVDTANEGVLVSYVLW